MQDRKAYKKQRLKNYTKQARELQLNIFVDRDSVCCLCTFCLFACFGVFFQGTATLCLKNISRQNIR